MGKIAFLFPGQGSQTVGMGKELYEKYDCAKAVFRQADAALGFSLTDLCFEGPEEELKKTYNTQPAILTVSVACHALLTERGVTPDIAAGHSLGEYSALVAAGALSFGDAVRLVRRRGQFMQEAVPLGEGAMAAVLGLDRAKIIEACAAVAKERGLVQAVNFNCPGQVVIAGAAAAVEQAAAQVKAAGAKRVVLLPVSAPFHSALMRPAAEKLAAELDKIPIQDPAIPVVANVNGKALLDGAAVKEALIAQAASPVLWEDCVARVAAYGCDTCIEVGPGKVLTGFNKKIDRNIRNFNVEDCASLEKILDYLREVR